MKLEYHPQVFGYRDSEGMGACYSLEIPTMDCNSVPERVFIPAEILHDSVLKKSVGRHVIPVEGEK